MTTSTRTHDLVGIGLGPFNLGLAALAEPLAQAGELDVVFLEARDGFNWHPGLMFEDATLQVPFLADVVSLADPTSRFSFLNWLKQTGRLYAFYIRESFLPHRREYNQYCQWVADQLAAAGRIRFGFGVSSVEHDGSSYVVTSANGDVVRGRRLALGTGSAPYLPECSRDAVAAQAAGPALHAADYLTRRDEVLARESITVVGSGQSAAEVYLDLLTAQPDHGYHLTWVTRSPRFFPMEYTKLTLEMTSPEYTAYFQGLDDTTRARLLTSHQQLYKGISSDTVNAIHDLLYTRSIDGSAATTLLTASELTGMTPTDGDSAYRLELTHTETGEHYAFSSGAVVLSTGYRTGLPEFLEPVRDRLRLDDRGRYAASATYAVDRTGREVFVQNGEEHTHGFVAPDLGMGAYRNSVILASVLGREVYPIEKRVAFQEFGVPDRFRIGHDRSEREAGQ
ncbi:lysine N(6)-hydroxylase/L-ornithine N(5)-oxygenase family protein [Nocardioides cavernaquae]|uniref:L-lysine N6-monooxygenase MbtG n=1 Tax=Nocardioides cavernaquae TaxID=2321396 RepID=A0A3A5HAI3_9ACTN|nr:SidA/IucD/PvdA family monooxygenase [Nocardioides cavernaquae]RJS47051.1 alcaligin biosynthesis protein [Nocardioides cavernaquae]